MKNKDRVKFIVYPAVLGIVSLGIAIGLVFYYKSKSNSTPISYVMCLIMAVVGVACVISSIIQLVSMLKYNTTAKNGNITTATFLSYETKSSVDKQAVYKVTLEYNIDGNKITYVSPSEFTWQEVLALKCAQSFEIKYYKNHCIMQSNLNDLILKYSKEIAQAQAKYDDAFNKVQNVLNQKVEGIQERTVTKVEEKKMTEKVKEEDKPDTGDDVQ